MAQGMKVEVEFHSTHHQSKKHQINVHKLYAQSKVKKREKWKEGWEITPKKNWKEILDVKRYYRQREFIMYILTCVYVKY